MTNTFRRIIILVISSMLLVGVVSFIFFQNEMAHAQEIVDVDHLTGQRIGVISAYEGDYLLSDRTDITLMRYDTEADLIVALCYKQVDAVAITEDMARYILTLSDGFKINEKPIAQNNMAHLFPENSKLMKEEEEYITYIKGTDEYAEYMYKVKNNGFYDGSPLIELTGDGETIKVGYLCDYVPVSFTDAKNGEPNGIEVEFFKKFANYMGYQIDWVAETETTGISDIYYGSIDVYLGAYSDVYREECDLSDTVDMGTSYRDSAIVLLEVEDYDKLSLGKLMDEES